MSLSDLVQQQLGQSELQHIGQQINADPSQVQTAVQAALPMLLGSMAQVTRQPGGTEAISGAMQEHAGLLGGLGGLGNLGSLGSLGGLATSILGGGGGGLLGKVLGGQQPAVQDGVQQASGLDSGQVQKLLLVLVPIVLAALAKHQQQAAATAPASADANGDGIPDVLQHEAQQAREHAERSTPHIGGIIGKILDAATRH